MTRILFFLCAVTFALANAPSFAQTTDVNITVTGDTEFPGTWYDDKGRTGNLTIRLGSEHTFEFGSTPCKGQRAIPKGELEKIDGKLAIVGDGKFDIDIGGKCGEAEVTVTSIDGGLKFTFHRKKWKDQFYAEVK